MSLSRSPEKRRPALSSVTVEDLLGHDSLQLELISGSRGAARIVRDTRVLRLVLPVRGRPETWEGRIHVLVPKSLSRLSELAGRSRQSTAAGIASLRGAALVVPGRIDPPVELRRETQRRGIPLLRTPQPLGRCIAGLKTFLEERIAPEVTVHGVLMEVSGVGMLILGPSGIGKSESAIDLVMRGHRLIADDLVIVRRAGEERLIGRGAERAGSHMEIRGLGIVNVRDLFGVTSVLECKAVDLVVDLREWDTLQDYDRLGLDEEHYVLLGVRLSYLRLPVSHGRNMAVILEVAARNHLLKKQGCFTARDFEQVLTRRLASRDERAK